MTESQLPEEGEARLEESQHTPITPHGYLADGEWHRMHPASPLLKGGIALIAILGVVIANLRERIFDMFTPRFMHGDEQDPVDLIVKNGLIGWALLAVAVGLILLTIGFYVSWRMHMFRITNEVVEVRSGIVFRTNRKARLDRIQGINIVRPFIARLFGAAKLEINQAGQDANIGLSYLGTNAADDLRKEILRLASGTHATSAPRVDAAESFIERRVNDFIAPELDPDAAPPESIVKLNMGRLIGSLALSDTTIGLLVFAGVGVGFVLATGQFLALFIAVPAAIGFGSFYVRKFTKSLRYSIAGTPDGIRVGFGLLSTSNETLPPGRIHSVEVSQPLLWRGPDWWEIKVNRASHSSTKGAGGEQNTTILPVGDRDDVRRVLALMLPELQAAATRYSPDSVRVLDDGLTAKGTADDGFTNSPPRAWVLRPFSWRRNGFAITSGSLVLRRGAIWRQLVIVPQPRLQSVSLHQGPLLRTLRLASVHLHTVSGPIKAELGAVDQDAALDFFEGVASVAVSAAQADTSHRWGASRDGAAGAMPA